jgi:hypothetical protein
VVQEQEKKLRILKFDRVTYKFHLRKVKTLSFVKEISPWNKYDGTFGNYFGDQGQNYILRI